MPWNNMYLVFFTHNKLLLWLHAQTWKEQGQIWKIFHGARLGQIWTNNKKCITLQFKVLLLGINIVFIIKDKIVYSE